MKNSESTATAAPQRHAEPDARGGGLGILASPWVFIPAIYLVQGVIEGGILGEGITIMYKDMGYSNAFIGRLSLLHMPLILAFLWAPYVDQWASKRNLTVVLYFVLPIFTALVALAIHLQVAFTLMSVLALLGLAVAFSFFRVAIDGYYIRILTPRLQAGFVGVKTTAIRLGIIAAIAGLVNIAGRLNLAYENETVGWMWMFVILTGLVLLGAGYCLFFLPRAEDDQPVRGSKPKLAIYEAVRDYLRMNKVVLIIVFILVFRFGEGLLRQMSLPFFMDTPEAGGFGLNTASVAMIKAFADMPFTIVGGLLGGWIIKKWGLRKTFLGLALCMSLPNLLFWYIAKHPTFVEFSFWGYTFNRAVYATVCVESFGYGIGFSAFFYFLHAIARGRHKTSLFAISTALMGLGFRLPSAISGDIQEMFGYQTLFLLSVIAAIPGIALICLLPLSDDDTSPASATGG